MMIVDDREVIIGSANLNDRSLIGDRDSEIAVLIRDACVVPSMMNGKSFLVSKFGQSLRLRLWREHLGILNASQDDVDLCDAVCDAVYDLWRSNAKANLLLYTKLFPATPTNHHKNLEQFKDALRSTPSSRRYQAVSNNTVTNCLECIRGYIVEFPQEFLSEEDLKPSFQKGDIEGILPDFVFH